MQGCEDGRRRAGERTDDIVGWRDWAVVSGSAFLDTTRDLPIAATVISIR